MTEHRKWYPLRVTYSRELKVKDRLSADGLDCFVPMRVIEDVIGGCCRKKVVPAVNNLCFVRAAKEELDRKIEEAGLKSYVHYIWNKSTRKAIYVPDKDMDDFIRVASAEKEDIVYIPDVSNKLREGQKVRVLGGPFVGIEGTVVRLRRSQRVMVELKGMLAVATSYIPKDLLMTI